MFDRLGIRRSFAIRELKANLAAPRNTSTGPNRHSKKRGVRKREQDQIAFLQALTALWFSAVYRVCGTTGSRGIAAQLARAANGIGSRVSSGLPDERDWRQWKNSTKPKPAKVAFPGGLRSKAVVDAAKQLNSQGIRLSSRPLYPRTLSLGVFGQALAFRYLERRRSSSPALRAGK